MKLKQLLYLLLIGVILFGCGRKECKPYKQYENDKGIFTIDLESGDTLGRIYKLYEPPKCDTVFIHDTIYTSTHINKVDNLIIQ